MGNLPQVPATCCRSRRPPSAQSLRQRVLARCKTGRISGRKKGLRKSHLSQQGTPVPSQQNPRPVLSLIGGHIDPTVFRPRSAPNTHKGQHASASGSPGSVPFCLRGGHSAVSPRGRKLMGRFATPALEDAPRRQATGRGHSLVPYGHLSDPRCLPDAPYGFFPVTATLGLVAPSQSRLLCPVRPPQRPHRDSASPRLPPGVVLKSVPPGVVL